MNYARRGGGWVEGIQHGCIMRSMRLHNELRKLFGEVYTVNRNLILFRRCSYGEKLSRVEGSPAYPSYPGRANFSYISLQNLKNRSHEKQKVGSARRVTRLAGLPFWDGRVTLLAGPTFLHINTLARLAGSTRSRRDDQSMRELCCYWKVSSWLGQRGQLFSHINAR